MASCKLIAIKRFRHNTHTQDGWTTNDLKYQWKAEDPVQITKDHHLPRFTLEKYVSDYCNIKTNTGETMNSEISVLFKFKR